MLHGNISKLLPFTLSAVNYDFQKYMALASPEVV